MADRRERIWKLSSPPSDQEQSSSSTSNPSTSNSANNIQPPQVQSQGTFQPLQHIFSANNVQQTQVQSVATRTSPSFQMASNVPPNLVQSQDAYQARVDEVDEMERNQLIDNHEEDMADLQIEIDDLSEGFRKLQAENVLFVTLHEQERQRSSLLERQLFRLQTQNTRLNRDLVLANRVIEIERARYAAAERRREEQIERLLDVLHGRLPMEVLADMGFRRV